MRYLNRQDAGEKLATALDKFKNNSAIVVALPRGGVVIGAEIAKALVAPLDVRLVRKISHPHYSEYAIGAINEYGDTFYNENEVASVDEQWLHESENEALEIIKKRHKQYYGHSNPTPLKNRVVIIVDDGIATGYTMKAAINSVRREHPKKIIIATPVASFESLGELKAIVDELVILDDPDDFKGAIGAHYFSFPQVDDSEVERLLNDARRRTS